MKRKFSLSKIAGALSVLVLGIASVSPDTLQIPLVYRPWVFVFTIAWIFLITSGVFS
jgi:hypothetical protein